MRGVYSALVSVPYSSGVWLTAGPPRPGGARPDNVSVPYSSGVWLTDHRRDRTGRLGDRFSPLFIGSLADRSPAAVAAWPGTTVSVPYSSGVWLTVESGAGSEDLNHRFSPLFIGSLADRRPKRPPR